MEKKKTGRTIKEKAARMPDIREPKWDQIVPVYLESVKSLSSELAKSHRFLLFLNDLFGLQPGFIKDYVSGIEKYIKVKQKDRILKGRVDDLFGNLIIEFERDLDKKEIEAKEQLRKYVACLWSQELPAQRTPYLCIASDGIGFTVYSPTVEYPAKTDIMPDEVRLEVIEQIDLSALKPQEVYFWLDRYLLRREILAPKTENIVKDFGVKSHAFRIAGQNLLALWQSMKAKPEFTVIYEGWEKYLTSQNPQAKYLVLYNAHGTYLCACATESYPIEFDIAGQKVQARGFVAESETYCFETTEKTEGNYLASFLNAPVIDNMIKPMQARGLWGARHIHKKVLELPIPQFDNSVPSHLELAKLGELCSHKVANWIQIGGPGKIKSIGKLRAMVREMLAKELTEIDRLVGPLLN